MTSSRARLYNTLTLLFLALALGLFVIFTLIFLTAPPTPGIAALPTSTPGPPAAPTATPTPSRTPRLTNTATHTPTPSPLPSDTPAGEAAAEGTDAGAATPSLTPTPTLSPFNYVADVEYTRSQYGLNWAGVAGLVYGLDGKQQTNIVVRAWGDPPLGEQGQESASGLAPQYGVSGWEFTLGSSPVSGTWHVQLMGDDGRPLSDAIAIEMTGDPRQNLAYISFIQNH